MSDVNRIERLVIIVLFGTLFDTCLELFFNHLFDIGVELFLGSRFGILSLAVPSIVFKL
jgi:hypothetical protein